MAQELQQSFSDRTGRTSRRCRIRHVLALRPPGTQVPPSTTPKWKYISGSETTVRYDWEVKQGSLVEFWGARFGEATNTTRASDSLQTLQGLLHAVSSLGPYSTEGAQKRRRAKKWQTGKTVAELLCSCSFTYLYPQDTVSGSW